MSEESAVIEKHKGLTFKRISKADDSIEVWEVSYVPEGSRPAAKRNSNKERVVLGSVKTYLNSKSGGWSIAEFAGSWATKINVVAYDSRFQNKEDAGWALLVIKETCESNPLPSSVKAYVETRARHLRDERSHIQGRFFEIQREQYELQKIAESNGLDMTYYDFGADLKKEVSELLEFLKEHNDSLYEHQGKDFARSLRARIASVVKLVDPEAALDI